MLTTSDYKKIFEFLASAHRGSIIVIGGGEHRLPIRSATLNVCRGSKHDPLPQTGRRIEKLLYRTEEGTCAVANMQLNENGKVEDRLIFFGPVSIEESLESKINEYPLTRREREIALWVMRGLSNREIAEKLFICEQTVKDHLHDIFERRHVRRRSQLIAKLVLPAVHDRIPPPLPSPKRQSR